MNMTRRRFLGTGATLGAGTMLHPVLARTASSDSRPDSGDSRPNILFIHVDQLSFYDSINAYGDAEHVKTPNIDRVVKNGISFMQSYATDPVCCPARTSWFTSTYSSENGVVENGAPVHDDIPDLSPLLQKAGYETVYTGKWHVPGRSVRQLFKVLNEGSWYGEMTDSDVTRTARTYLRDYKEKKPFFLSVGYLNPHDICMTPGNDERRSTKKDGKWIAPYIHEGILAEDEVPPLPKAHGYDRDEPALMMVQKRGNPAKPGFSDWGEELWRMHRYNYHRFVEMVDAEIGMVLDELEHSPHRDNTLIVFTSDHGDGMSRHWGIGKRTLYEESVHVPFVIATLGDKLNVPKDTRDSDHLVSGIDLGRTVCDYAGADSSILPHGLSLRPLVEGEPVSEWRKVVYAESAAYMHMVVDGRFKYVRCYQENEPATGIPPTHQTHKMLGGEQLFDLKNDRDEQRNLASSPEHAPVLERMRAAMDHEEDQLMPRRKPSAKGQKTMLRYAKAMKRFK